MCANRTVAKVRGVFEKEPGSGIWLIRYHVDGKPKREKVGRHSDAITLYPKRKSDTRAEIIILVAHLGQQADAEFESQ